MCGRRRVSRFALRWRGWEASWAFPQTCQQGLLCTRSSSPGGIPRSGRRRRPSGQPPPLPHPLQATGVGWLIAAVVLVALSLLVFAGELRGAAVAVTVVDDAVVRWLAGLRAPGLLATMKVVAALGSWMAITVLLWGLLLALLILRRLRHLLVVLVAWTVQGLIIQYVLGPLLRRPRPFGVEFRTDWRAWALPSEQMAALVGRRWWGSCTPWCRRAAGASGGSGWRPCWWRWSPSPTSTWGWRRPPTSLVGVAIGVTIPLLGFRLFAPSEVFPVTYRRGRAAHLDVGGARGQAIRRALQDQLGLAVEDVEPFGLAGSAGSTPLRIKVQRRPGHAGCSASSTPAATCAPTAGTSSAGSCCTAGWRTRSRSTRCGGWSSRRTTRCTRCTSPACPRPRPYGFVELTPEREYLLVTEFFDGAAELGEADVDDARHRRRPRRSSASCGTPAWPTATSSRPTCWSATAICC